MKKLETFKIEWENDEILLPDMFDEHDPDHLFAVYPTRFDGVKGFIAFDFTNREIWQQVCNDDMDTYWYTLNYAERKKKDLANDYYNKRAEFRRMQKLAEKMKLTRRLKRKV